MKRHTTQKIAAIATTMAVAGGLGLTGLIGGTTAATAAAAPHSGGSLTVLENAEYAGSWPQGLDPGTDGSGSVDQPYMDAIYGELFELGPKGAIVPDLATGYKLLNGGKTVEIDIRHGVTFSDGTPFNAAAVQFNIQRDLKAPLTDTPTAWPVSSITTPNAYTVDINLKQVYGALINTMVGSNVNWIGSPTAINKEGESQFKLTPVGAGPFTVASDTLSTSLVLKKNPNYWQKGLPYLDNLTFKSVASDDTAYEALQAGQGQAYEGLQTPQLVKQISSGFQVTDETSTAVYVIQMNTKLAPFNNIKAREAVYYATNTSLLDEKILGKNTPTQSFTAPSGLFYNPKVPGYRTYDLAKAKALVKQLGGLKVQLYSSAPGSVLDTIVEAVQQMWQQAGMSVTLKPAPALAQTIAAFDSGQWEAFVQTAGAFDPAAGIGVSVRFSSTSEDSGVHDPKLDSLFASAVATTNTAQRKKVYDQAAEYISQKAYGPFLFPVDQWNIAAKGVSGPGLTTALPASNVRPEVLWQDVSVGNS